ncbi:hypothetical protein KP509_36G012600 [Ceratopteris richardii]|nr:hypothetical protein KP509_36G012600 [Ceratopteris richardii]
MLHNEVKRLGLVEKNYSDALITMYSKCGAVDEAQSLLNMYDSSITVPWTSLIAGYARRKQGQDALDCFELMQKKGVPPNEVTYVYVLKACAVTGDITKGKQIHEEISRKGFLERSVLLGNILVDMYAKCGALPQAKSVLETLPSRDVVTWNTLISRFSQAQEAHQALECFEQMRNEGISPDAVTYASILKACALIGAIDKGVEIHDVIQKQGFLDHDVVLGGALVHMYAKCGKLSQARTVLQHLPSRSIVVWSALMASYVQKGLGQEALEFFEQLQQENIRPDALAYTCVLKACALVGDKGKGKKIHDEILRERLQEQNPELVAALVEMYVLCGDLLHAHTVLLELSSHSAATWNPLIVGYTQNGQGHEALECYKQMEQQGIPPDSITYASVLKACNVLGASDIGQKFHVKILKQGLQEHDIVLGGALVDMYAKCDFLPQARSVLNSLPSRDIVVWNALLVGYAQKGQCDQAWDCFEKMQIEDILPNTVTFLSLLNLCSHLGLLEKGQVLFNRMVLVYGLEPRLESYNCLVDLFGRAGNLANALRIIEEMPFSASSVVWLCLSSACQKCRDGKATA